MLSSHSPIGTSKQLINQTIETLTIALSSQSKAIIKEYIPYTMEVFLQVADNLSPDYFFAAWSRFCLLKEPMDSWVKVYEKILKQTL